MKILGYKVYDASTSIGLEAAHFSAGQLVVGGTADAVRNLTTPLVTRIVEVKKIAAVAADAAEERRSTLSGAIVAGEKFTATLSYGEARQKVNKRFTVYAVTGETATTMANKLFAAINAAGIDFTAASGAAGRLDVTRDTAGVPFILTVGTDSAAASFGAVSVATAAARRTDAAFFAEKFDGVLASDFGSATDDYQAFVVSFLDPEDTVHGIVQAEKKVAFFIDGATAVTTLETALNGTNHQAGRVDVLK
jgi:hypothetical protein